ncbi:MAG: glycosyltransferase family 2 protein [Blautia sp.]|nr:glycosyltransferase family 2 protein [Lachnoclostridium sp.]MCM1212195.1 glycosyltransferase family 2 protein [Blautia sp.]
MKEWFEKKDYFERYQSVAVRRVMGGHSKTNETPLVTVAIPAYKRTDLLKEAMESVLRQKGFSDYELIVVDNYAEDNPEMDALMSAYTEKYPHIVYYKNEQNIGMGGNWNRCIELAKGDWVVLLHDDDMLCENYLKTAYPIAVKTGCTLLGTFSSQMNQLERGETDVKYSRKLDRSKDILSRLRKGHAFEVKRNDLLHFIQPSPGCWMIHKKANLMFGGYDAERKKSGLIDGPFNFKNTWNGKTVIVPQFLFVRRIKENDFLNVEAQRDILTGLYSYIRHYAETYTKCKKLNKWIVDISILNFARGMKAKYKAEIDTARILKEMGVSGWLLHMPDKVIYLLNMFGLGKLVFRKWL